MKQTLTVIAHMENEFTEKFGIPRQSGLVQELRGRIKLEPEFVREEALRGLETFSHIWLIWGFSESKGWSPTVRPPRLGGNKRVGVFSTRSPFRPNGLGLSAVRLDSIDFSNGILHVSGADLMNGTPIYDIKPYLPFADSYPDAVGGFADEVKKDRLQVVFEEGCQVSKDKRELFTRLLEQDPRPSYQSDPQRVYGLSFGTTTIRFTVQDGVVTVREMMEHE